MVGSCVGNIIESWLYETRESDRHRQGGRAGAAKGTAQPRSVKVQQQARQGATRARQTETPAPDPEPHRERERQERIRVENCAEFEL